MPDVVVDTNVFVRGLLRSAVVVPLINAWKANRFRLLTSEELLQELVEVLARPKLRKYFQEEQVKELLLLISEQGKVVEPLQHVNFCRDPKDNIFLDVAIAGQADYLVTEDNDLKDDEDLKTTMRDEYGVEIVDVLEFMAALGS
jgi:putative PIN family toxin of toxin-antitoxin system